MSLLAVACALGAHALCAQLHCECGCHAADSLPLAQPSRRGIALDVRPSAASALDVREALDLQRIPAPPVRD